MRFGQICDRADGQLTGASPTSNVNDGCVK
jgi:hypothetical protein